MQQKDDGTMKRHLVIRLHAAKRMLERDIRIEEIENVVDSGEIIEDYQDDTPFPSRLMLGAPNDRPLHVVAADEPDSDITHVITAYVPDPEQWDATFKRRKK